MPPINICLLMCPLTKQPVLPSDRGFILQGAVMCIIVYMSHVVDTSQHTTIYPVHYMLPQASRTFPTGDESVFRALTWLLLTLCCFSWSWSHPCCFCCHIINLVTSCIFPILHHMSYHLVIFSSTSIAYTLCLVTSLPSITHHHARKEDHVEKEACEPAPPAVATSACICIIITATSYRRENCKAHCPHHIVTRLTIGSHLEAHISGRVAGRI